jgi:hypothetical protein
MADLATLRSWKPNGIRVVVRKGQRCRILARGRKNSVPVEFEDGFKVVPRRHAVRIAVSFKTV